MFWKIFLWFWLASAFVIGASILVTAATQTEPMIVMWRIVSNEVMAANAVAAADAFERDGERGLQKYLDRAAENSSLHIVVYDKDLRQLAAHEDLPRARELAVKAATVNETVFEISPPEPPLAAKKIQTRNNQELVLVVQLPRPHLSGLLIEPQTRVLRLLAVILSAGLVCYGLARYLTSPLRKLRQATQKLAGGDLSVRVADKIGRRRDEISGLARDFDEMAARIEDLLAAQKNLTTDISHELRSPLARLGVALEIARNKTTAEAQPALDRIERESARLNEMISQMLLLSRLESGTENIEKVRLDFSQIVAEVVADADFEAQSQNKSVKILQIEQIYLSGEARLLQSAVENIVRNAVRHTAENTSVEISLVRENGQAVLKIRDYGDGVPAEDLPKLFRPFYRVGFARERNAGGFGLGLAITERAVKAHGGAIKAENADGLLVSVLLKAEN
jgi:signal transduction histidine kinase